MKAYIAYKTWWIKHKELSPTELKWGATLEGEFKNHINSMTLYELMETLEDWEEDQPTIKLTPPFIPPTPPYKYDPWPSPFPRPMPTTPPTQPVWPGVRNCSKCGINLDGVMGYVCSDQACPTFRHVWSGAITGTITAGDTGPYFGGSSNLSKEKK